MQNDFFYDEKDVDKIFLENQLLKAEVRFLKSRSGSSKQGVASRRLGVNAEWSHSQAYSDLLKILRFFDRKPLSYLANMSKRFQALKRYYF